MTQDKQNLKHYIADEGKVFIRKADQFNFGNEIYLGRAFYIGGEKLKVPKEEVIEDFEEVDDPDLNEEEITE